ASPYRAGNEVIGALTPLDVTAGTIDCCYCAIGTGGKDEFTIDGGGQLVVVLALTVTNLDAPASLQANFLLEIHQFCWLFNVIIAEHAATTQGQQGYGQHSISHLLLLLPAHIGELHLQRSGGGTGLHGRLIGGA